MNKINLSVTSEMCDKTGAVQFRVVPEFYVDYEVPFQEFKHLSHVEDDIVARATKQLMHSFFGEAEYSLRQVRDALLYSPCAVTLSPQMLRSLVTIVQKSIDRIELFKSNIEISFGSRDTLQSLYDRAKRAEDRNEQLNKLRRRDKELCEKALRNLKNRRSRGLKTLCRQIMEEEI